MAFRKAVFEKLGGFRTDLGPRPGSAIRSEDTEFGDRVLGDGQRLWYEAHSRGLPFAAVLPFEETIFPHMVAR